MHHPYNGGGVWDSTDQDDAVNMVRHGDEGVEESGWMMIGDGLSARLRDRTEIIQDQFTINDFAE